MSVEADSAPTPGVESRQVALRGRGRIQSVARASALLYEVARSPNGLTTREIGERLGVPQQTAYHLVHTLRYANLIVAGREDRYLLGLGVSILAEGFERHLSPSEHLGPYVREVAQVSAETAYAAGWNNQEIVILASALGSNAVAASSVPVGTAGFAHARASGKLLLALASDEVIAEYLATHPLEPRTARTITSKSLLYDELRAIRARGYATDIEEFADGLCCVSMPLCGGAAPLVLCLSAPAERFHSSLSRYRELLREVSARSVGFWSGGS